MDTTGWDSGRIYAASALAPLHKATDYSHTILQEMFYQFVENFYLNNSFVYREQLRANILTKHYAVNVDLAHLEKYSGDTLLLKLKQSPAEHLPLFEEAVRAHAKRILNPQEESSSFKRIPPCQVTLTSSSMLSTPIRHLDASCVGKLVRVSGMVIAASSLSAKATQLHLTCKTCGHSKILPIAGGYAGVQLPRSCDGSSPEKEPCPIDPYVIVHEKSKFIDQQSLKLQETPEMLPIGELPRHMLVLIDRTLVNRVHPGIRVNLMGIYSIFQNSASNKSGGAGVAIRTPYIRVVGIEMENSTTRSIPGTLISDSEEAQYVELSKRPDLYELFVHSIAPSIYGNIEIKKAIACLLFGGSHKKLPDGMRLRGDINVLLLGDPSTAKSQFLKFVEKVAPIAVYTSGKGSSAAGLTASVIRDSSTREFYLEGGAMVLADGGVVCIDEFDKMREEDRVAIHEAMEQQTISIAKAGLTTVLNARTSVLAAANPVFGRYDDMKTPGDNIDFQTTILSRFDMIFIVKDEHNEERDQKLAKHVMNVHVNKAIPEINSEATGELSMQTMRGYINFCRTRCFPRLSAAAAEKLCSHFVELRNHVKALEKEMEERSCIPITVRQLEAITRISEALARMRLSPVADEHDVDEALRLFRLSTLNAAETGPSEGTGRTQALVQVRQVEQEIRRRLPIGSQMTTRELKDEMMKKGFVKPIVEKALQLLISQEVLHYRQQRLLVYRVGV